MQQKVMKVCQAFGPSDPGRWRCKHQAARLPRGERVKMGGAAWENSGLEPVNVPTCNAPNKIWSAEPILLGFCIVTRLPPEK